MALSPFGYAYGQYDYSNRLVKFKNLHCLVETHGPVTGAVVMVCN